MVCHTLVLIVKVSEIIESIPVVDVCQIAIAVPLLLILTLGVLDVPVEIKTTGIRFQEPPNGFVDETIVPFMTQKRQHFQLHLRQDLVW